MVGQVLPVLYEFPLFTAGLILRGYGDYGEPEAMWLRIIDI
ncbi:hypothetical protein [Methanogenium sp. MK-MG]|nr:hypothetical protein [Methanogenium sp. MK-MG]